MSLQLSPEAVRDIEDIFDYSARRWGVDQAETYVRALHAACRQLVENPALGRRRPDIPPPWLVFSVGSHLIVFRVGSTDDRVEVLNILHPAMDIAARLTRALQSRP